MFYGPLGISGPHFVNRYILQSNSVKIPEIEEWLDGMLISRHTHSLLNPIYNCCKVFSKVNVLVTFIHQWFWASVLRVAIWCIPLGEIGSVSVGKEYCVCCRVFIKWWDVSFLWFRKYNSTPEGMRCSRACSRQLEAVLLMVTHVWGWSMHFHFQHKFCHHAL